MSCGGGGRGLDQGLEGSPRSCGGGGRGLDQGLEGSPRSDVHGGGPRSDVWGGVPGLMSRQVPGLMPRGGGLGPGPGDCTVGSNASWVMVTWGSLVDRQTHICENITFSQLRWRAVISTKSKSVLQMI